MNMMQAGDAYAEGMRLSGLGAHAEAIAAFERALTQKPDDPKVLFALGNTARALGMSGPAAEFFRRVLAQEPGRPEAAVNLANVLRAAGDHAGASRVLEPALAVHPDSPELWLTLGSVKRETGDHACAEAHYRQALSLRPQYAVALSNLADILSIKGGKAEALALYDRAIRIEPDNAQTRLNRAILHLDSGRLKEGWRDYAARLKLLKAPRRDHGLAAWSGGPLKRTTLLVCAEQGIGDQIMFASAIPDLLARAAAEEGRVILECEPRLAALFARSFPAATVRPSQMETQGGVNFAHYGWLRAAGGANAAIEMGSLPRYLRGHASAFPRPHAYLVPDAAERTHWRAAFADLPRPLVGVCWRSGSSGGHRTMQYAPRELWVEFLRTVPGTPVSVQYDAGPDEIAALEAASGRTLFVPPALDQKNELDRTAAMLSNLDAVVSAPTAVSWLAAALGVATGKVLYHTSWTSFGEDHEPFAPAALCLTPERRGDWSSAFARATDFLSRLSAS